MFVVCNGEAMLFGGRKGKIVVVAEGEIQRLLGVEELDLEPAEDCWELESTADLMSRSTLVLKFTPRRLLRHSMEVSHFALWTSWRHGPSPSGLDIKLPAGSSEGDPWAM